MKKTYLLLTLLLIGLLVFPAAGGAKPVQLTFWPSSNPQEIQFAKTIVERWNEAHPDIQVKMEPLPASRSTEEVLLAAIAAGTTPDICANIYPGAISQYIAGKGLLAHDTLPGFYEFIYERTPKEVVDTFTYRDGHVYQIPWKSNPVMMAYNVKKLAEYGVDPKDLSHYSSFLEAARKFKKDHDGDGTPDQWLYSPTTDVTWWQRLFDFYPLYIGATQGKTLIEKGKVVFDCQEAVDVFEFLGTLFREGLAAKGAGIGDPFFQGKVATVITGPYTIPYYLQNAPEGFEFDFVPIPVPDYVKGPVYTYGDPKNIAIFANTKHPEEAWEFVKFILSSENDRLFLDITSQIPYRKDIVNDPLFSDYFEEHPIMARFVEQGLYTRAVDDTEYLIEIFDAISRQYDRGPVQGRIDAKRAVQQAARAVRDILAGW